MKFIKIFYILLLISSPLGLLANAESSITSFEFNVEKLNEEKNIIHYDLNQIIDTLQRCINSNNKICIPKNLTEYERLLFTARRIQHNDSQFVAIEIFNYLLEFKWYRNKGEELYLKLLLANSLDYIGASYLASEYMEEIFPEFINYLESSKHKRFYINHYASRLFGIEKIEESYKAYKIVYDLSLESKDSNFIYKARNNMALTLGMLSRIESAKKLMRINQNLRYKTLNPIIFAFSFGNYGTLMKTEEKYDSAIYYGMKEVFFLNEINSKLGLGNTYQMIGECYEKLNQRDSAVKYLNNALSVRLEDRYFEGIIATSRDLIELHLTNNENTDVNFLFKLFDAYNDSLTKRYHDNQYEDEIQIYNYLEILDEAQISKQKYDELITKNKELNYSLLGFAILVISLIVFIIYRRTYRVKLIRANEELQTKNEELEKSYKKISVSNLRNETLLKELHHRVKNNLQIVSSLFNLQINDPSIDEGAKEVFEIAKDRILSISMLHKKLYLADSLSKINFKEYLEEFGEHFILNHNKEVELQVNIENLELNYHIDAALPLGLIFNELFTNSLKHAKPKEKLKLCIDHKLEENQDIFIYKDNGTSSLGGSELTESTGLVLIDLLAKQIESSYSTNPDKNYEGFYFIIQGNFRKNIN